MPGENSGPLAGPLNSSTASTTTGSTINPLGGPKDTSNYQAPIVPAAPATPKSAQAATPATPATPVTPVVPVTPLSTATINAAQQMTALLSGYGLTGNIASGITAMLQNGLDMTTILNIIDSPNPSAQIQGLGLTPTQLSAAQGLVSSWQQRFAGNQARIAAGLNPLSPAEYIANEQSYKQVMAMAGIPQSSPLMSTAYLGQLMGQDVSPAEVQMRVAAATAAVQNEDPQVLGQLQSQFGLSMPSIITHLLDPSVAAPLVQQEYNAALIGAEASRAGVSVAYGLTGATGPLSAMGLAAQGVTHAQAQQGFQQIATQLPAMQSLASRYQGYTPAASVGQQLEASTFNTQGAAQAQQQLERLKTQEVSAFSGSAGAATGSLGAKDVSGLS